MRALAAAAALALLPAVLAGCSAPDPPAPYAPKAALDVGVAAQDLACRLLGPDHQPLRGTCEFRAGIESGLPGPEYVLRNATDGRGVATERVPANATALVVALAEGHASKAAYVRTDLPRAVTFVLPEGTPDPNVGLGGSLGGNDFTRRAWSAPLTVEPDGAGAEPHVAVDAEGTVYYSAAAGFDRAAGRNTGLYRSTDGGATFHDVSPQPPDAAPTLGSDTSLSLSPDGSVWFSRYVGYPENTIGCTSTDKGESWTCDQAAFPGATDRMWIVGLSATEGYLQSNEGLAAPGWMHTATGSLKYLPHAADGQVQQHGNMAYDEVHGAVWQVTNIQAVTYPQVGAANPNLSIMRIDGAAGLVTAREIPVPRTYAINWLAAANGTLWTTGEPDLETSPSVVVAHSSDGEAREWALAPVSVLPRAAAFSYVAAAGGRAAAVYYGSDRPGPSTANGGQWSLYVAESNDARAADATWVETRVVERIHEGNVCIGLACEESGGDPAARDAGDLIGIAMDRDGNVHVSYVEFQGEGGRADYMRQVPS